MSIRQNLALQENAELIENVGLIAERLLAVCLPATAEADSRAIIERALLFAAEAEQRIAAQKDRINRLEALSFTDELTGLYNRRGFNEEFRRVLALADRLDSTGVLAFIDLDHFKVINDGLGHTAGDAVLREVAELLSKSVRATDVVARIGGDEFAALLVHTAAQCGRRRATALERQLNAAVVPYGEFEIPICASFGIKPFGSGDDAERLLAQADRAMYRKKRAKPQVLHPWRRRWIASAAP
ncbi:MAG: GGDEF domain-containing protein [Alphaproteobacteria bacterium]